MLADASWKCAHCGLSTRAAVRYPIHCACGLVARLPDRPIYVTWSQRLRDTIALADKIPPTVTAIAGVPRSGMFAAGLLAELLHLSLHAIHPHAGLQPLASGWRHSEPDDGLLVVVDDTIATGKSFRRLPPVDREHLRAVVYASPQGIRHVDIWERILPTPHYLEWNLFNSVYSPHLATDFDGVLCADPPPGVTDGSCEYERWLQEAPIRQRPRRVPIPLIATARLRQYRRITEIWLARHGITCDHLVMWDGDPAARWTDHGAAKMKAAAYAASTARLFVESDQAQAQRIHELTGKTVICTSGTVFTQQRPTALDNRAPPV